MNEPAPVPPPPGLGAAGRQFWRGLADRFDLESHEQRLLLEAARCVDLLDALQADIDTVGTTVEGPQGVKTNPSVVEARQQRVVLARLVAALGIPVDDEEDAVATRKPPGRPRGVYGIRGAS